MALTISVMVTLLMALEGFVAVIGLMTLALLVVLARSNVIDDGWHCNACYFDDHYSDRDD